MSASRVGILLSVSILLLLSLTSHPMTFAAPAKDMRRLIRINSILKKEETLQNGLLVRYFMSDAEWSVGEIE